MGKKEIFYVVCAIALLFGAYFFIYSLMFPKPKSFAVYGEPKISKIQQKRDYYEKNSKLLDAKAKREQMKYARELEKIRPLFQVQMKYLKDIDDQIAKLPPNKRNDQNEILKIIAKEREKYMYTRLPGQKGPMLPPGIKIPPIQIRK